MVRFSFLLASALDVKGTLNNMPLDRVVTLNTSQKITGSLEFKDSLSLKRVSVNKFFGDIQLDNIVYQDEVWNVSNKLFNG